MTTAHMELRIITWNPSARQEQQDAYNQALVNDCIDNMAAEGWTLADQQVTAGMGMLPKFFLWFRKETV